MDEVFSVEESGGAADDFNEDIVDGFGGDVDADLGDDVDDGCRRDVDDGLKIGGSVLIMSLFGDGGDDSILRCTYALENRNAQI